jgi:hypothetical protein
VRQGKKSEATQRFEDRRQREDEAPRLATEVPSLKSLRLEVHERTGGNQMADPVHVRRVIVERAPALFVVPCGDSRCRDAGHGLTSVVMRALRNRSERFEGEDICTGSLGMGSCARVLHFVASAEYTGDAAAQR